MNALLGVERVGSLAAMQCASTLRRQARTHFVQALVNRELAFDADRSVINRSDCCHLTG